MDPKAQEKRQGVVKNTLKPVSRVRGGSVTVWLIALNVLVYIADEVLKARIASIHHLKEFPARALGPLQTAGFFSINTAVIHGQMWRVVTCQFLHVNLAHLVSNVVGLWVFGEMVEVRMERRRFLFFYMLCGIAGPIMYTALWLLGVLPSMDTPLIGASAGIFGIMVAAAYLEADGVIDLYVFQMPLKYFAWIMVGIAAYTILRYSNTPGENAGGQAAHLGGAVLGFILIRYDSALNVVRRRARKT